MGSAKDIHVKPVDAARAKDYIREHHYSGKVKNNAQLHLGVFYNGSLRGAMQFGPPIDREKALGLVAGTEWNEMMELNRFVTDDSLPPNSESRALSVALKLFDKHAPHVKWILSYADATSCGDGAIYRATNFVLTGIKESHALAKLPDGRTIHKMALTNIPNTPRKELNGRTYSEVTDGRKDFDMYVEAANAEKLPGYQLRYIYFLDEDYRDRLTVDEIPYERIDDIGAGMYKGKRISIEERKP